MSASDIATRLVRRLPPETAHRLTIAAMRRGIGLPPQVESPKSLAVTLPVSGLRLPNPIGLAAGFDKNAEACRAMLTFGFGFVECGTVTPRGQAGNPRPRLFRLTEDRAVINRMGFNNEGLAAFISNLSDCAQSGVIGANVGANKDSEDRIADYVTGLKTVWAYADYVTLNISSPNTPGLRGLQDKGALEDLLGRCGEAAREMAGKGPRKPVFLKVAPDVDATAISEISGAALSAPYLQGLIVSNTTIARPDGLKSALAKETGGLSGAPLMKASTEVLAAFHGEVGNRLDLIGAGGIARVADVRAKLAAGARAVQLYSALVYEGPGLVKRLLSELAAGR